MLRSCPQIAALAESFIVYDRFSRESVRGVDIPAAPAFARILCSRASR